VANANEETERVTLTLPDGVRYSTVGRILVGGLAARHNLSYESLDDLQLAVEAVLARGAPSGSEITLELLVDQDSVIAEIGPVDRHTLNEDLVPQDELDLSVVLAAVVDGVSLIERDGTPWMRFEKHVVRLPRD
jgi:hypothetical protein